MCFREYNSGVNNIPPYVKKLWTQNLIASITYRKTTLKNIFLNKTYVHRELIQGI